MTKYAQAPDSLTVIVSPDGEEKRVTERAFSVVYAAKGYTRKGEIDTREELKKNHTAKELKAMLDEKGIDYGADDTKDELVNALIGK